VAYQLFRQRSPGSTAILVRAAGTPTSITSTVRQAIQEVDQDQPMFDLKALDEELATQQWPYVVFGSMFSIFALTALVLSAVGIYAVTSYAVTQRTSEIGVRMALGAQPKQVSWLILKSGCWQLAIGLTLGLLGGWGVTFVMRSLVVQISPTDPVTFVGIASLLGRHARRVHHPGAESDEARSAPSTQQELTVRIQYSEFRVRSLFKLGAASRRRLRSSEFLF
jgi:hypothetical protein